MGLHQIDLLYVDARARLDAARQFRMGEPSGMLVAIARLARLVERTAARTERWARRPAAADYLPRIPAR